MGGTVGVGGIGVLVGAAAGGGMATTADATGTLVGNGASASTTVGGNLVVVGLIIVGAGAGVLVDGTAVGGTTVAVNAIVDCGITAVAPCSPSVVGKLT